MAFDLLLVPHRSGADHARVWAGVVADGPPPEQRLLLQPGDRPVVLPAGAWRTVQAGGSLSPGPVRVFVQIVSLEGLSPGTRYRLAPPPGERGPACRFSTLPQELPETGQRPFTVLLASCFHHATDGDGTVGRAVQQLPADHQPDVKILCGDQVYLDLPSGQNFPDDSRWLADNFLGKYIRTFFQHGGFAELLSSGATYFTADDHEYWNNAPNSSAVVNNSWTAAGRARWRRIALDLFRDFQSDEPARAGRPQQFSVGSLSFFLADTRTFREEGTERLLLPEDLDALRGWLADLRGPGVLCVGQPMLEGAGKWFKRTFQDRVLPDYDEYRVLCQSLHAARHSVVVVSGDVHFGRVAGCELVSGKTLVEIISSPASLCNPLVGGKAYDAPGRFPAEAAGGLSQRPTRTMYKTAEDNFATLQFSQRGGRTEVMLRFWFPRSVQFGGVRSDAVAPILLT